MNTEQKIKEQQKLILEQQKTILHQNDVIEKQQELIVEQKNQINDLKKDVEAGSGGGAQGSSDTDAKLETEEGSDFIIPDWNMPNMSGLEFVNKVRDRKYKEIPILMVTTRSIKENIIESMKTGVSS